MPSMPITKRLKDLFSTSGVVSEYNRRGALDPIGSHCACHWHRTALEKGFPWVTDNSQSQTADERGILNF